MVTFEYLGIPLTHQKITPGDTATALSAYCYRYKCYRLNLDDIDVTITAGEWIMGVTSGAAAVVKYVYQTAATNGTGYVIIDSWNGIAWTNDEETRINTSNVAANVNQAAAIVEATDAEYNLAGMLQYKDMLAKYALVVAYANTALVAFTGATPSNDVEVLIGTPMVANASLALKDHNAIANFKCLDYTVGGGSACIIQVDFCF